MLLSDQMKGYRVHTSHTGAADAKIGYSSKSYLPINHNNIIVDMYPLHPKHNNIIILKLLHQHTPITADNCNLSLSLLMSWVHTDTIVMELTDCII